MTLLRMRDISKKFGASLALSHVNLNLEPGEVLGLVGENGAGKSTLVKIIAGVYTPDTGNIEVDDRLVVFRSPASSAAKGIGVIHQELMMVPHLSVAENIFLGHVPQKGALPWVDRSAMYLEARNVLKTLDVDINPHRLVGGLTPGYQQLIEISRAVYRNVRILVMDEPTSSLSKHEVGQIYSIVQRLKEQGIGIIYISHHLEEIFEVSDRVMVLRDGYTVETRPIKEWSSAQLVEAMVNRKIEQFYPYRPHQIGETTLVVSHLKIAPRIEDVSFDAHRGEILGIAGTMGSGRGELLKAIFGALPNQSGTITWLGKALNVKDPAQAIRRGLVLVPGDRKIEGLMLDASIENNIVTSILKRLASTLLNIVNFRRKREVTLDEMKQFHVVARGPQTIVRNLSGGNQQKVVFARTSATNPMLYLLDEPTRGVDVGAKVEVYNKIMEFAQQGGTVLLVSSELPELLGISDRVIVITGGRVVGDIKRADATQEQLLQLSTDDRLMETTVVG